MTKQLENEEMKKKKKILTPGKQIGKESKSASRLLSGSVVNSVDGVLRSTRHRLLI